VASHVTHCYWLYGWQQGHIADKWPHIIHNVNDCVDDKDIQTASFHGPATWEQSHDYRYTDILYIQVVSHEYTDILYIPSHI